MTPAIFGARRCRYGTIIAGPNVTRMEWNCERDRGMLQFRAAERESRRRMAATHARGHARRAAFPQKASLPFQELLHECSFQLSRQPPLARPAPPQARQPGAGADP